MMKKRSILSWLLAFCLCFAMAMPTFAAEKNAIEDVVVNDYSSAQINENILEQVLSDAKEAIDEERAGKIEAQNLVNNTADETTYTFYTNDDEHIYVYEEAYGYEPTMTVYDTVDNDCDPINEMENGIMPLSDFDPGIGGKQTITKTGSAGSYLTTKVTLPTTSQVSSPSVHPYVYSGFSKSGQYEADFGVLYSNNNGPSQNQLAWRMYAVFKKFVNGKWVAQTMDIDSTYNGASYRNGYKPGSDVIMYVWYNNNGKTRLKLEGTTICPTNQGTSLKDTSNISIYQSASNYNISSIDSFKVCATLASSKTGKNKAIFSLIKVDGTAVTSASYYPTPSSDGATVTRNSNTVTINVNA